ncbi:MAG: hypothetical protein ACSHWW_06700 [Nonlabens sp.]|uniref:hypothetical protein n=1 Tax=Nonlabens sp. TaxID=1888209 RepID=UPI003EF7DDED
MRYIFLFLLVSINATAQRYDTATSYLKFIDSHHADVVEQTWNYMYTYTQEDDYQKRNGQRKKLENVLNKSLRYVVKQEPYDEDFQRATINYLKGNIAIVNKDFMQLLKSDKQEPPAVDKAYILSKIRKAMFQLRTDYDNAVLAYGNKYDLKIESNKSAQAQQMKHTINVYDYYNNVNALARLLKETEAYLWQDVIQLSPEQFNARLEDLKMVIDDNRFIVLKLNTPSDSKQLQKSFLDFQKAFTDDFINHTPAIIAILKAYETNDRSDIVRKTEEFNKAKTWYNVNRREAYDNWSTAVQTYLRSEVKPI